MDGGVIRFSINFEGKILLLDKILKKNLGSISKVLGGNIEVENSFAGVSIRSTDSTF
jgi:hypothetical protein